MSLPRDFVLDINMATRRPHLTINEKVKINTMYRSGTPIYDIMRKFKLKSPNSVYMALRQKYE